MQEFRRMWSGKVGDFIARCDFDDQKNRYLVSVFHLPTGTGTHEFFDMTCWTAPIFDLMEVTDAKISRDLAEKLIQELEKELI